ncbi:M48 family metallopeptidase, partial [Candidatus Latescibacterota bacterium]
VWISENSLSLASDKKEKKDIFDSLLFDEVSVKASPAALTAAVKGFWTRYSRSQTKELVELPVEGYDIPPGYFESFSQERAKVVSRDNLHKKYKLPSSRKRKEISYEREHSVGYACASSVAKAPLIENERLINYVHVVGWYIAESTEGYDIPFKCYVLDTDRVNAIACPGGYVVLTRGLLELLENESELAALLAHEMAHVIAGHGMLQVMEDKVRIKAGSSFDVLDKETGGASDMEVELLAITDRAVGIATGPKLDEYEFEADEMALLYLARSGYDLNAHMRLLDKIMDKHEKNIDIFDLNYRNHPDFKERLNRSGKVLRDYKNYRGSKFTERFKDYMVFY